MNLKTIEVPIPNSMELTVLTPVFNEEAGLQAFYDRTVNVLHRMGCSYELLIVNDGSTDHSLDILRRLSAQDPNLRYLSFSRNFGHQVAVSAGLDHCKGKAVVIIDADLQDPPELIPNLYERYKEGYQVVYAKRNSRAGESVLKKSTAGLFYRILSKMTHVNIPLDTGDFRIIDHRVVEVLRKMPEKGKFIRGQIAWAGFSQTHLLYDRDERHAGETGYTFRKMVRLAIDGITAFSNVPLKFATVSGFIVSLITFIIILYTLYSRFIIRDYVPGWTSIMLAVLFIGGVQLICIGIIGEYISRISDNVRDRPLYIIEEKNF
ncbi:MAG: hypothetical protein RLZZ630_2080 [Bacteroidota bacterium]|jgi:dolichol-phosphate mannosyltransferase